MSCCLYSNSINRLIFQDYWTFTCLRFDKDSMHFDFQILNLVNGGYCFLICNFDQLQ